MAQTTSLKHVLFIAGDVGGARALLPVIRECEARHIPFAVAAHGHMVLETPRHWPMVFFPAASDAEVIAGIIEKTETGSLVFGSSVHDSFPLTVARQARKQRIPVIHVLDNWTGYRRRLEHDGLPLFLPDIYAVMDEVAYDGAVADGIDPAALKITGHPALSSFSREIGMAYVHERMPESRWRLLFVSEPVEADQGGHAGCPGFRGYTESQVLDFLCSALQPYADRVTLSVLPHPREKVEPLRHTWKQVKGRLEGGIITKGAARTHVLQADGVAGMASLLLYEAWLAGKPVISLQPDLRLRELRMLQRRESIVFLDSTRELDLGVATWIAEIGSGRQNAAGFDRTRHDTAASDIAILAAGLIA